MSEWFLFNAKWEICKFNYDKDKLLVNGAWFVLDQHIALDINIASSLLKTTV